MSDTSGTAKTYLRDRRNALEAEIIELDETITSLTKSSAEKRNLMHSIDSLLGDYDKPSD